MTSFMHLIYNDNVNLITFKLCFGIGLPFFFFFTLRSMIHVDG